MKIKPLQTHRIITIQRPLLWLFNFIVLLCLIAASMWASYEYGRHNAGYDSAGADDYIEQLRTELEESKAEIVESNRRATMIERNSRIDDDANSQLKDSLSQAQNEVLKLKKDLAFYKSIVAPEQGTRNIAIESIELKQNDTGEYLYKIMAVQRGRNDEFARGTIEISIVGQEKGKQATLQLSEISKDIKKPQKFGFKYFQNFEGVMNLPDAFKADSLHIKMKPSSDKIKEIDEKFVWSELTAGGA